MAIINTLTVIRYLFETQNGDYSKLKSTITKLAASNTRTNLRMSRD